MGINGAGSWCNRGLEPSKRRSRTSIDKDSQTICRVTLGAGAIGTFWLAGAEHDRRGKPGFGWNAFFGSHCQHDGCGRDNCAELAEKSPV
jgi:hypothetical protein